MTNSKYIRNKKVTSFESYNDRYDTVKGCFWIEGYRFAEATARAYIRSTWGMTTEEAASYTARLKAEATERRAAIVSRLAAEGRA